MNILKIGIEFIVVFIVIYSTYYFFTIRKCKNNKKYVPVEVNLILVKYKIDIDKVNIYQMIKLVCMVTSLILSISIMLMNYLSNSFILSLLIGVMLSVVLSFIIYGFIGKYYSNKNNK